MVQAYRRLDQKVMPEDLNGLPPRNSFSMWGAVCGKLL